MHFIFAALYTCTRSNARIKLLKLCFTHVYAPYVHKQLSICLARQSVVQCTLHISCMVVPGKLTHS